MKFHSIVPGDVFRKLKSVSNEVHAFILATDSSGTRATCVVLFERLGDGTRGSALFKNVNITFFVEDWERLEA